MQQTALSAEKDKNTTLYSAVYVFKRDKDLITVKGKPDWIKYPSLYPGKLYPHDCLNTKVIIDRHRQNEVKITALLRNEIVTLADESLNDYTYQTNKWRWVPWQDDVPLNINTYRKVERIEGLRGGGSRLKLWLNEPGEYHLTIPHDADLNLALSEGDIEYKSLEATRLSIERSKVNYCGNSGSSTPEGESWDYYRGSDLDPVTRLITKKGYISVP
jgi:hypothetical protein